MEAQISGGAFVAVVGRSGSGKSTLLHLLAAMDRPTWGEITVGSWKLARLSRKEQARYRREMMGAGKTVVVVTHHLSEIDHVADRVIELHNGRSGTLSPSR